MSVWKFSKKARAGREDRPGRHDWRHTDLAVRPVPINTAKDPRYRRERTAGFGSSAPYVPRRLGLAARRTGRPALD